MKKSYLTVTDQFCGAGGNSQAVRRYAEKCNGGIEVTLAMNHWKLAIDTHNTNFPDTMHACTDVSACDPRRFPTTNILITSPECTTHSPAGGNNHKALKAQMDLFNSNKVDPATERSRATMWDVCRFAEYHRYEIIIVENVVEAKTRWPLFDTWLKAMHVLGYNHKTCFFNSMHFHPTPQSRDRMYVVFWKKGNKAPNLDYKPLAYCPCCNKDTFAFQSWKNPERPFGKYKQQYVYRCSVDGTVVEPYYYASFNIIDWSIKGKRIGDRIKPLSHNTLKRIQFGLDKYENEPFLFHMAYGSEARGTTRRLNDVSFSQTTSGSTSIAIPFLVDNKHKDGVSYRVRKADDPVNTVHCDPRVGIITPPPFIIKLEHTSAEGNVKSVHDHMQTQTVTQSMGVVVPSFSIGDSFHSLSDSIIEPLSTRNDHTPPSVVTQESMNSFLTYYNGTCQASHITDACGTQATHDRMGLVQYEKPSIDDCHYRMLNSDEVKLAMAFDRDYKVLGSSKDQVKQCGNAVTPPVMEWLFGQAVQSLN
uniref:DNA (cytosine-5-)-methyltransferase n=1 Tax=Sphingobacterium sp. (strain 21) TaxID=743722 RepID=F4C445_SPHS2